MVYKLPKKILEVFKKFQQNNFQLFLVGGSVRDLLMNKESHDWDFTTDAKPEQILKLFPDGFYNNKFGTVGIPIKPKGGAGRRKSVLTADFSRTGQRRSALKNPGEDAERLTIIEITTMRKEGDYKDHRHPVEVSWTNKIEEDLARRDFTINAIALQPVILSGSEESQIKTTDPFNGQQDLQNGILKAVGNPDQRFKEDALRLIRAIRISSQLEFEIESDTLKAIGQNKALIKDVAKERIRDELFKIFVSTNPYIGMKQLRESGILKIILPEVDECFGVVQEGPRHDRIYDIGEHSLLTLKFTPSKNPVVLLAALLHDIGKVKTYHKDGSGNVTFFGHDVMGAKLANGIAKRLNLSKTQTDKLIKLVRFHMFTINEDQTDSAIRRFVKNVGVENIDDIFALRVGDRLGGGTKTAVSWRMEKYLERIKQVMYKPFAVTDLKVNGEDVMKTLSIAPGRKVGEILHKLFQEVEQDQSKNDRGYLLKRISQF